MRHAEPGRTRFVGRERELRLLRECFELAQAGQGQVVLIVGEPGIGKSRLLHEFRRRLGRSATWVEGQALSFGRRDAVPSGHRHGRAGSCRIEEADPEAVMVDKLEQALRRLGRRRSSTRCRSCATCCRSIPAIRAVRAMDPERRHAAIVRDHPRG